MKRTKIKTKKIKMGQVWQADKMTPVTFLRWDDKTTSAELEAFSAGLKVFVSGLNKGRGFQGVVKRHGFHGGPKSHGQKDRLRAPGSIGATAPQRVIKGKRMAGHMGQRRTTVKGSGIVAINPEEKLILLKGPVPGMRGSIVEIRK